MPRVSYFVTMLQRQGVRTVCNVTGRMITCISRVTADGYFLSMLQRHEFRTAIDVSRDMIDSK